MSEQQQILQQVQQPGTVPPIPQPAAVQQPGTVPPIPQPATVQQPGTVPPIPQPATVQQPGTVPPIPQPATVQQPAAQQPQQANPYQSIIDQQNAQIAALMAQNNALNQQVTQMVQGGAQFNQQAQQAQQTQQVGQNWAYHPQQQTAYPPVYGGNDGMPLSLATDVDVSLESLASEIGKKD